MYTVRAKIYLVANLKLLKAMLYKISCIENTFKNKEYFFGNLELRKLDMVIFCLYLTQVEHWHLDVFSRIDLAKR